MGAVDIKETNSSSSFGESANLTENSAPGNSSASSLTNRGSRPVIDCGDLDMRIARDGTWYYRGSPIGRPALVKLFASVLRREPDGSYWLVTPAERGRVEVEDVPFLVVALTIDGDGRDQQLIFRTNLDEFVTAGFENPIRVETAASGEPSPYIHLRHTLAPRSRGEDRAAGVL